MVSFHSLIPQIFIRCLLGAKYYPKYWEYTDKLDQLSSGEQINKKNI